MVHLTHRIFQAAEETAKKDEATLKKVKEDEAKVSELSLTHVFEVFPELMNLMKLTR